METKGKNKSDNSTGAPGVQSAHATPGKRGRGRPPKPEEKKLATVKVAGRNQKHGLYCDPRKVQIDGRSFFGQLKRRIKTHFLECFKGTPSALVQALADGAAANLIMAKAFQAAYLRGEKLPSSILRDYTGLWNSISRDLATLSALAKESGAKAPMPSLNEYVDREYSKQALAEGHLKRAARAEVVQASPEPEPVEPKPVNSTAPAGNETTDKKTLF